MLIWLVGRWALASDAVEMRTVDVINGGLFHATHILCARFGATVNYEGVPLDVEGYGYRRVAADGEFGRLVADRGLVFRYPADAPVRVALDAAVAAYNVHPDAEGHFRVVETNGLLHVVPSHVRLADGSFVPYRPFLDVVVTLDVVEGTPTDLYRKLFEKLETAFGAPMFDVLAMNRIDYDQWTGRTVTLPSGTGAARDLLDAILVRSPETRWTLVWAPGYPMGNDVRGAWGLAFHNIPLTDDNLLNRTPLVGEPIGPVDFVPQR